MVINTSHEFLPHVRGWSGRPNSEHYVGLNFRKEGNVKQTRPPENNKLRIHPAHYRRAGKVPVVRNTSPVKSFLRPEIHKELLTAPQDVLRAV